MGKRSLEDEIREIAVAEAMQRTWNLSKQFLKDNLLLISEGTPVVEDIIIGQSQLIAHVYFPVRDEDFFFDVVVDFSVSPRVQFVQMSAGNTVQLLVVSDNVSLHDLLALVDFDPSNHWEKGQTFGPGNHCVHKNSGFSLAPTKKRTGEVENKLKALLEMLTPHKESVRHLSSVAHTEIDIAYYGYKSQMWGISLDQTLITSLAELNLSVDIDLYAGGPDLE